MLRLNRHGYLFPLIGNHISLCIHSKPFWSVRASTSPKTAKNNKIPRPANPQTPKTTHPNSPNSEKRSKKIKWLSEKWTNLMPSAKKGLSCRRVVNACKIEKFCVCAQMVEHFACARIRVSILHSFFELAWRRLGSLCLCFWTMSASVHSAVRQT